MKNFKRHVATVILYFFCMGTVLGNFNVSVSAAEKSTRVPLETVSGQLVIKLRDTKNKEYENIIKKYNGKIIQYFNNYVLSSFEKEDVDKVKRELTTDKNVEYSEENAIGKKSTTNIDPLASTQDYLFYSRAMDAWNLVTDQMKQTAVKVAVVDSGVKSDHPDLTGSIEPGMNYVGGNTTTTDDNGHGTQVAGVIAAKHNNVGINGIAGLINTRIIPVKVLDANGVGTTANIAQGIIYAANSGAQIINLSINGKGFSKLIDDAVQYALAKGAIVVASSGDNNDYAENYWPCNSNGTIVAAQSKNGDSNVGKNVDVFVKGVGKSTDIGVSGYKTVAGSSISAAITTGTIALIKAKNPSYTLDQIRSILSKSTLSTNEYGQGLSIKKALQQESDFITITSPVVSQNTTGDIAGNITALNPSQLKQISLFINDNSTAYKVIQGNGSKNYNITIPFTELVDGVNKIKAVALDTSGKTYVDERNFKSLSSDKVMRITVKDTNGNPAKNKLVRLSTRNYSGDTKEVKTGDDGQAVFYNVNKDSLYSIVIQNGDADSDSTKLVFIKNDVTPGKLVIDLSKESKVVSFNAYKADNTTMLSSAKLMFDDIRGLNINLNKAATTKIIVNKNYANKLKVLSEQEGYYYEKNIGSFENLDTVNFNKDDNTAKIDINNIYDSQIVRENMEIYLKTNDYDFGQLIGDFDVKNKSLYLPKGDYQYFYRLESSGKDEARYVPESINLSGDTSINYMEPKVNIQHGDGSNFYLTYSDQKHSFSCNPSSDFSGTVNLKDPNGKVLVNGVDFTYSQAIGVQDGAFKVVVNKPISGNYQISATTNYMGKSFTSNTISMSFADNNQTKDIAVKYTLPAELQKLITAQGDDTLNVQYYVYNAASGALVYGDWKIKRTNEGGEFNIPASYGNSSYRVVISGNTENNKGFIYDRSIDSAVNGVLNVNQTTSTRKISFGGTNIDQYVNNSTLLLSRSGLSGMSIRINVVDKASANIWLDDGDYTSMVNTDRSLLTSTFSISPANTTDSFDTSKLSTLKFTLPSDNYVKNIFIKPTIYKNSYLQGINVDANSDFKVSPGVNIEGFKLQVGGIGSLTDITYNFSGQYVFKELSANNIDLSKCTVQYSNLPSSIEKNNQLYFNAKVSSGTFTLDNAYRENSYLGKNDTFYEYDGEFGVNIYNSSNKFISKNYFNSNYIYNNNNLGVDVSNLYSGDFTANLDLPGLNIINSNFSFKITGDDQRIKIMDPFDTTKPLSNGTVNIDGYPDNSDYKVGRDGYVYIPKNVIGSNQNLVIRAENDKGVAVFKTQISSSTSDLTIATSVNTLKSINIKPLDSVNGSSIAYAEIKLSGNNYSSYSAGKLDGLGQGTIYTNIDFTELSAKNDKSILCAKYSGQGDIIIDNKNVAKINVSLIKDYNNNSLNIRDDKNVSYSIQSSGTYNLTPGSYSYDYHTSSNNYSGSFNIVSGEVRNLMFGNASKLVADYHDGNTSNNVAKPGQNIDLSVRFKDDYGNFLWPNMQPSLTYIVSVNGIEVKRGSAYGFNNISLNPNVVSDSFDIKFETSYNNQKYTSNALNYKMNLSDYQKVTVKDPAGNVIKEGKFGQSNYQLNGTLISNGVAYIDKRILQDRQNNVSLSGMSSTGYAVIYTGLSIDSSTTEIKDTTANKLSINSNIPSNVNDITFNLYKNNNDINSYNGSVYYEYYSSDDFNKRYKNNYLWVTSGDYIITANVTTYNSSNNVSYLLADTISGAKTVNLDYSNTTKIDLNKPDNYYANGSLSIGNVNIYLQNVSDNYISKVSSNIFNGYNFSLNDNKSNTINYSKKLNSAIAGDSYTVYFGNSYSVKADNTGVNTLAPNQDAKAYISVNDQYGNYVTASNNGNSNTSIELSNNGQVIGTVTPSSRSYNNPDEIVFSPNLSTSFNAVFKINILGKTYSSNSISYSLDTSNYKSISVNDPSGNPLKTGQCSQYGNSYKINQGIMFIPKDTNLSGTLSIQGKNTVGDYVIAPQVTIDSSTSTVNIQGKKVNVTTDFGDIGNINSGQLEISWYNYYNNNEININYGTDKSSVSNINIWLQDKVNCYIDNCFYGNSGSRYIIGNRFNNSNGILNMSVNKLTEVKFASSDNKDGTLYISQEKNGNYKGSSTSNKLFVSSGVYYANEVHLNNVSGIGNSYVINDSNYISGPSYTVFVGSDFVGNFSISKNAIKQGENIYIYSNIKDNYGNNVSFSGYNTWEYKFINSSGATVKTISASSSSITVPSDIVDGKYSLGITMYNGDKKLVSGTIDNIYITSGTITNLGYYGMNCSYKVYDGTSVIYSGQNSNSIDIPNSILIEGRYYDLDILEQDSRGVTHYKKKYLFSNGSMQYISDANLVKITLDSSVKKVALSTSRGDSIKIYDQYNSGGTTATSINLNLLDGENYNIIAYCEDSNGGYWAKNAVKVDNTLKEVKFDRTLSRNLSLSSKFANNIEVIGLTAKDISTGDTYDIGRSLNTSNSVNLPIGSYELNFKTNINGTKSLNDYKKTVDLTKSDYTLTIGDKLTYDVALDKSTYSPYDKVSAKLVNVKDGEVALAGIENSVIDSSSITMNLMHGSKTVKTFSNTISDAIKGDANFVVKGNTASLGSVSSKVISLVINNSNAVKEGDINLDGIVDIFDIVYVAKDFGKTKGQSDYDPRVNLDSSDTAIDAKDLAKVAVNYEN